MARLILEEAGQTRRFQLHEGTVTIGSGEGCTLRLTSPDVAERHAELEFQRGTATLRLRRGVTPARVAGRSVSGEATLAHAVPIEIGSAKLRVEYEDAERASLVERRSAPGAPGAAAPAAAGPAVRAPRGRASTRARTRSARARGGFPTWLVLVLLLGAAFVAYKFMGGAVLDTTERGFSPDATLRRAQAAMREGDVVGAMKEVERAEGEELSEEWRREFAAVRQQAATAQADAEVRERNRHGTEYFDTQLERFESSYLSSTPEPAEIRVFLKRLAYFRSQWPDHPKIPWVDRMEARYGELVDLTAAPTFEDVEFEVKSLTWAKPRDYQQAFEILQRYIDRAEGDDRQRALELYDEKAKERDEFHVDRLQQAKYDWERGNRDDAVRWLVNQIVYQGVEAHENQAADILVQLPGIDGYLRAYQRDLPDKFERLAQNPIVAGKIDEFGLR